MHAMVLVSALVEADCDLRLKNVRGETALQNAEKTQNKVITC